MSKKLKYQLGGERRKPFKQKDPYFYQQNGGTGYQENSPDVDNSYNLIDSNHITMKGVNKKLLLIPKSKNGSTGKSVVAKPGDSDYIFPGHTHVLEIPMKSGGEPSPTKALEMLHNPPHGKPLTDKQRKYFGYLSNKEYGGSSNGDGGFKMGLLNYGGTMNKWKRNEHSNPDYSRLKEMIPGYFQNGGFYNDLYSAPQTSQSQPSMIPKPLDPTVPLRYQHGGSLIAYNGPDGNHNLKPSDTRLLKGKYAWGGSNNSPASKGDHLDTPVPDFMFNNGGISYNNSENKKGITDAFNKENMFADSKNQFIDWLKKKSIQVVHNDLDSEHQQFMEDANRHFQMGGLANPYNKEHGGCMECGGMTHMNTGGDISIPDIEKYIPSHMKKGGHKSPHYTPRNHTTHGYSVANSSYQGDHDLSGLRSYCGGDINHDCITAAINDPDPHVRKMATLAQKMRGAKFQMGGPQIPGMIQSNDPFNLNNQPTDYNFMNDVNTNNQVGPVTTPVQGTYPYTQGDRNRITNTAANLPGYMVANQSNKQAMQTGINTAQNVTAPGLPEVKGPKQKSQWGPNLEAANLLIAGMDTAANIFGMKDRKNRERFLKNKTHADQVFSSIPASEVSRGDYSTNEGYFRPDQTTPVQNSGAAGQYRKSGGEYSNGEYYLSDKEVQRLRDQGYNIEELD